MTQPEGCPTEAWAEGEDAQLLKGMAWEVSIGGIFAEPTKAPQGGWASHHASTIPGHQQQKMGSPPSEDYSLACSFASPWIHLWEGQRLRNRRGGGDRK